MIYDPRIATVSRAEFDELMAILRPAAGDERPLSEDDRWRRDYQAEQEQHRVVDYQQDLRRQAGYPLSPARAGPIVGSPTA